MSIVFLNFFQNFLFFWNPLKLNRIDIFVEFFNERRICFVRNKSCGRDILNAADLLQPYARNDISAVAVAHMETVAVQRRASVEYVEFGQILFSYISSWVMLIPYVGFLIYLGIVIPILESIANYSLGLLYSNIADNENSLDIYRAGMQDMM